MATYTGTTDATGKVSIPVPAGTYTVSGVLPVLYLVAPNQAGVAVTTGAVTPLTFQVTAGQAAYAWVCTDSHGGV